MINTLNKVIALLTRDEQKSGLLVLLLVIGMAILDTAGVASVMPFLAVLGNPDMLHTNTVLSILYSRTKEIGLGSPNDFLIALGFCSFALIIFSAVYRTVTYFAMNRYIEMLRHSICTRLLEGYLRQPYAFFLNRHSGDMSKTILSEVDQLIANIIRPVFNMAAYSLVLITITALLLIVNPWLAFLSAGLFCSLYLLVFLGLKHKLALLGESMVNANKERFMAAGEALSGIKDIKLLGREQTYLSRFQGYSYEYASTYSSYIVISQIPKYMIEALAFGGFISIAIVMMMIGGGLTNNALGQILPTLGLYAFSAYRLQPALQAIYSGVSSLRYGQAIVDNLYSDLCLNNSLTKLTKVESKPLKAKHSIGLKNLSFTYPNSVKPALEILNLEIPIGTAIGLVGTSGSGKTTLVDVILGLLRPTQGAITVDGSPVTDEKLRSWQRSLGYVPQEIFLNDSTVAENIAFGIPEDQIDMAQVQRCAEMAQVHNFILQDLPSQYQTSVGERGVRLSGGQRQRIGIARALYHDPEILVFDEATSALDTVTEQAVMTAIDNLAHQKTIILVAHRLSTVKNCDQIVLLEAGRIKVAGTYENLCAESEKFIQMTKDIHRKV